MLQSDTVLFFAKSGWRSLDCRRKICAI